MQRIIVRRRLIARATLFFTTILTGSAVLPAWAQVAPPPPVRQSVDENGVDLFRGTLAIQGPAMSIGGSGQKGLSYYKIYRGEGWTDNLIAVMNIDGSSVKVTFGGVTDGFIKSGTAYVSTEGKGSSLSLSGSTYTYIMADGTVAHFDTSRAGLYPQYATAGRVTDITSPSGETLTYGYASVSYCARSKPGSGGSICTAYATAYRLATIDNRYGYRVLIGGSQPDGDPRDPDEFFDLNAWSTPSGVTLINRATGASVSGTGFSDAAGQSAQYRYVNGVIAGITRPGGSSENVTIGYSGSRVESVTTAAGTVHYAASDAGNIRTVTVTDVAAQPTGYTFDIGLQRMRSRTDPLGHTTQWDYDGSGRISRVTLPEQNYTQISYDTRGNVVEQRSVAKPGSNVPDLVTSATFPAACASVVTCNEPETTTDARGGVTNYDYDPTHGGVLSVTAPAQANGVRPQTRYTYAAIQNSVTGASIYQLTEMSACRTTASCIGAADEVRTTIAYESGNLLPVSQTVAAGDGSVSATVAASYDGIGNVVAVDEPLPGSSDTTRTVYDALRRPTLAISPDPDGSGPLRNRAVRSSYDALGRAVTVEAGTSDTAGNGFTALQSLATDYDAVDRRVGETLSGGGTAYSRTAYSYDVAGRLACTAVRMDPAQWNSQNDACTPQTNGPNGADRVTRASYDVAGKLRSQVSAYGTAAQTEEKASYTDNGRTASVTDGGGNLTAYTYDGFDRLIQTNYPIVAQGAQAANGGDYERYGYDPGGNVTTRRLRDGQSIAYTYDALGRMVFKDVPVGVPEEYDVTYSYDLLGHLTKAEDANTHVAEMTYDALGRKVSERSNWTTRRWDYDEAGRRTRLTWGDGFFVTYEYDAAGEMTLIRENGGLALASFAYDDLGRRGSLTRGNGTITGYVYDAGSRLRQLSQYHDGSGTLEERATLDYNPAGQITNRVSANDAYAWGNARNTDRSYVTNGLNQYQSAGAATFDYDGRGNLIRSSDPVSGATTFGYTSENRLATIPGKVMAYDPLGRFHWIGSGTTWMQYDGADLIEERNTSGVTKRYVFGPGTDEPLVSYEGAGTNARRYLHADERGSIIALSDDTANVVQRNTYDTFGIPGSSNAGRFGYTGQAWIAEAGLWYYKARMYSPTLGRFLQTDPIGYGDGLNAYNYVGGDPVNFTDPSGLRLRYVCVAEINCGYKDDGAGPGVVFPSNGGGSPRGGYDGGVGGGVLGGSGTEAQQNPICPRGVGAFLAPSAASEATTVASMLSAGARAALGAVGFALTLSGDTNKGAHDLYRAVGPVELGSIRATGRFSLGPSGFSQKQFFTDLSSAQWYASWAVTSGADKSSTIVQTTVTDYTFSAGYHFRDAGRAAVSYSAPALQEVNKDATASGIHEIGGC